MKLFARTPSTREQHWTKVGSDADRHIMRVEPRGQERPLAKAPEKIDTEKEKLMRDLVDQDLSGLKSLSGFIGACIVDADSGMLVAQEGGGSLDMEVAAAVNTEVVKAKMRAMEQLNLDDEIEDILITLGKQYHLIRPLNGDRMAFYYLALDRTVANLALARVSLRKLGNL